MKKNFQYFYPSLMLAIFLLSLVTDWHNYLVYALTGVLLVFSLDKLGKGIVMRELIAFHGVVICLLMPLFGYDIYNQNNALARLYVKFMPVPKEEYFSFALPAMAAFALAITWPIRNPVVSDTGTKLQERITFIKGQLQQKPTLGVYLIVIGLICHNIAAYAPEALRFVLILLYWGSFTGIIYVYYTKNFRFRKIVLLFFVGYVLADAIRGGMFTVVAYMGISIFSFYFLNRKTSLLRKIAFFAIGVASLMLLQSIKARYRALTWKGEYEGSKVALFTDMFTDKLLASSELVSVNALFPIYYRANQGYNVGLVMRRIPRVQDYDNGRTISLSLASAIVPRLLWPDKPIAGGKFNMKYYAGISLRGWSTNIGPLGEAYGSFGVMGGIIFMFVLGLFIRWAYKVLFKISSKIPLVIFWLPVIFYQITYSMETDTLQILNSLFKGAFLVWVIYKIYPALFGVVIKTAKRRHTISNESPIEANTANG